MIIKNFLIAFSLLGIAVLMVLAVSCQKPDSEILGCVEGKIASEVNPIRLGCMTRVEFERYLQSPFQTASNGELIKYDLTFTKVEDCLDCQ